MEETALEFKNMCPYILSENNVEDEADQCVYETLEKLYRHTVFDLEQRADMEFFTPQYKLMYAEMEKFFRKSKNLRASNKYLQSELSSTIAELQTMQKLSSIDKDMIEQLKEEMERKWGQQMESVPNDVECKIFKGLYEQINLLSLLVSEKDGVIIELQDVLDMIGKMKKSTSEHRQLLLQENEQFKQELVHIAKAKQNMEENCINAEEKLKELMAHLQVIDAELLTERNEKDQLKDEIKNMASKMNILTEKCKEQEQDLETKSDAVKLKNEDYVKLCAEFEKANATIIDLTEKINEREEEVENLKTLLDNASSDVKHLEETVKTLQEMKSQLTCEKKELATMLQQYEMKYKSLELRYDSIIQKEEDEKGDLGHAFCRRSIFYKLTEECEKKHLHTKESYRQLKRYSGTLRDVIKGLEEQLAKL